MRSSPAATLVAITGLAGLAAVVAPGSSQARVGQPDQAAQIVAYHTSPGLSDPGRVPVRGVFEVTFAQQRDYGGQANFDDVAITVDIEGPGGQMATVGGFYYTTLNDGTSLWKARFAPPLAGGWSYHWTFVHTPTGSGQHGNGAFDAVAGREPGFLRINPANPFQLLYETGQPFVPLGFNDCLGLNDTWQVDGGDRFGAFAGTQSLAQYLDAYGGAGFNMFRFSQSNCSVDLTDATLTAYDPNVAMYFDWLMQRLRRHGLRVFYGLFGYRLANDPQTPPPPEVARFVAYSVHRWGAYVDVWELENERQASQAWIDAVAAMVRAADPYGHPVTTSWERPELDSVEINAPHWYQTEAATTSDQAVASRASSWKQAGKPVIVGEQGNSTPAGDQWGNWLPDSGLRMRLRTWAALFSEVGLLFWNNSWATNGSGGGAANLYIGPEERQYAQVVTWFAGAIGRPDMVPRPASEARGLNDKRVRVYVLRSSDGVAVYLHHFEDHEGFYYGDRLTIDVPAAGMGYWIDPATGTVWHSQPVAAGDNTLNVPTFQVDLAFFTTAAAPFLAPPIAVIHYNNPQADGDADEDGQPDRGPKLVAFGMPGLTLTLDARGSSSPNGTSLNFRWDFGDGSPPSESPVVDHTYPDGHFQTTLTVLDAAGGTARATLFVRASADLHPDQNDPPTLYAPAEVAARVGELVVVSPIGSDRELAGGSYHVDGHTTEQLTYEVSGLPAGAVFEPWRANAAPRLWWVPDLDREGEYTVTFTAVDPDGARSPPRTVRITVTGAPEAGRGAPLPTPTPAVSHTPSATPTPGPVWLPYAVKPEPATATPTPSITPEPSPTPETTATPDGTVVPEVTPTPECSKRRLPR